MVFNCWVIGSSVESNEEGPASSITAVLITAMQEIGVEEEGIATL